MYFIKIVCILMKFILSVAWGRKAHLKRIVYSYMEISIGDDSILNFNGESSVVSVGQKIWGVTVVAIKNDRVILKDDIGKFELKN